MNPALHMSVKSQYFIKNLRKKCNSCNPEKSKKYRAYLSLHTPLCHIFLNLCIGRKSIICSCDSCFPISNPALLEVYLETGFRFFNLLSLLTFLVLLSLASEFLINHNSTLNEHMGGHSPWRGWCGTRFRGGASDRGRFVLLFF